MIGQRSVSEAVSCKLLLLSRHWPLVDCVDDPCRACAPHSWHAGDYNDRFAGSQRRVARKPLDPSQPKLLPAVERRARALKHLGATAEFDTLAIDVESAWHLAVVCLADRGVRKLARTLLGHDLS